jgi:predicted PurR-regulated permease PerM
MGYLYKPFLTQIFVAILLTLATINLHNWLDKYIRIKPIKVTILTVILTILFFAPISYALNSLGTVAQNLDKSTIEKIVNVKNSLELPEFLEFAKPQIDDVLSGLNSKDIAKSIVDFSTTILKNSAGFIKDMFMILVFYFFVNYYKESLGRYISDILPFGKNSIFFDESANVMSIVFYSILITAIFEGTLFAIISVYYGHDGLLFGILYGFASLIPIVGGALMWIPLSLYEYANGNTTAAIAIAIYSIVVISIIADTFIKPMIIEYVNVHIIKTPTKINSIMIFFAILAGLTTFGFWGMIIGPAITTFFISFINIVKAYTND